jgi:hypothetical protein
LFLGRHVKVGAGGYFVGWDGEWGGVREGEEGEHGCESISWHGGAFV